MKKEPSALGREFVETIGTEPTTTVRKANVTTTRKTIEVPEDYFFRVKMRAVERHIKEKELWAEIVTEYFDNHPVN